MLQFANDSKYICYHFHCFRSRKLVELLLLLLFFHIKHIPFSLDWTVKLLDFFFFGSILKEIQQQQQQHVSPAAKNTKQQQ